MLLEVVPVTSPMGFVGGLQCCTHNFVCIFFCCGYLCNRIKQFVIVIDDRPYHCSGRSGGHGGG